MAKKSKDSATVTSKGQITLPKSLRDRLGVRAGDLMNLFGALVPPRGRRVTIDEMGDAIRRAGARSGLGK